jgi:hypothetical protein
MGNPSMDMDEVINVALRGTNSLADFKLDVQQVIAEAEKFPLLQGRKSPIG